MPLPTSVPAQDGSDDELLAITLAIEKENRLKKVRELKRKEKEVGEMKKKEQLPKNEPSFGSDDEELLSAALAFEHAQATQQDQEHHPRPLHDEDQDQAPKKGHVHHAGVHLEDANEAQALLTTACQQLSIGGALSTTDWNQEMLVAAQPGAGDQVGQGAGQAHHVQPRDEHLQDREVEEIQNAEHPQPLAPQLPPHTPPRAALPPGGDSPARLLLTPLWERSRAKRMSSSLRMTRKRSNQASQAIIRSQGQDDQARTPPRPAAPPAPRSARPGSQLPPETSASSTLAYPPYHPEQPASTPYSQASEVAGNLANQGPDI